MRAIAVLPARNEESHITRVIAGIKAARIRNIIVVDDASSDDTARVATKAGACVICLAKHSGVGVATRVGLKAALNSNPDIILFLDADGQHDPRYIPKFIKAIRAGADIVLGARDLSNYPKRKRLGNWALRHLANLLCPTGLRDPECGFRAITTSAAQRMDLRASGYEICMDFAYNAWKNKLQTAQVDIAVPIYYRKKGTKVLTGFKNFLFLLQRKICG